MLTIDFARFPVAPGDLVLDIGCGTGRHALHAHHHGGQVVAVDIDEVALKEIRDLDAPSARAIADGTRLPFVDGCATHVILSEVLEHIPDDRSMLAEAHRVLRPGGVLAVSVPRWFPEWICWSLSSEYHHVPGGHIRIYRSHQLRQRLTEAGLVPLAQHHAHGLHAPYWWLKCLVGVDRETTLTRRYHDLLVHEIVSGPWPNQLAARMIDAAVGKSLVIYARKRPIN